MKKVSNTKKVIAVIVTYNRKELLKESINALLKQNYKNLRILIIDNNSTDGTKEHISEELKNENVIYENTGENLGGAGGFNYGMKLAANMDCDYVWIMDDDCIVHKDSLQELVNSAEKLKDNFGFLSSKVLWKDNSICTMNIPKRKFSKWLKDFETNYQEIAMASFVSLFVKKDIVVEEGLPIKEFFIWTDDWEYTRRLSRKYKCYYITSSVVTHKSASNIGANIASVDGDRLNRFKYMYRNDVVLYRREGFIGWVLLYLRLCLHKLRVLKSDKKDKKDRIKLINAAIKEGKKFYPSIEYVKKNKLNVLEFFGEPLSYGGQEAFMINLYSSINKTHFNFTFVTPFECNNGKLVELVSQNSSDKIIYENKKFDSRLRKKFIVDTAKKYLNNSFDVIHIHSGSTYNLLKVAKIAKKNGIKKVIVHSHATGKLTLKYKIIKLVSDFTIEKYVDYFFACSELAGKWKFPKKILENNEKYIIIKNGIDIKKFEYSEKIRNKYRKSFNINNSKVVINVGRFSEEKNHEYMLLIFDELLKLDDNFEMFFVGGNGGLLEIIEKQINEKNLNKKIHILLNRNDVNSLLSMSDVFILPSLWEGLPYTGIEAQANGIPCIFSSTVSDEVNISAAYNKLSINEEPKKWAEKIIVLSNTKRYNTKQSIIENGFDISNTCKLIEDIYNDTNE